MTLRTIVLLCLIMFSVYAQEKAQQTIDSPVVVGKFELNALTGDTIRVKPDSSLVRLKARRGNIE